MLMDIEIAQHNKSKSHTSPPEEQQAACASPWPGERNSNSAAMESFLLWAQMMASVTTERHARDVTDAYLHA